MILPTSGNDAGMVVAVQVPEIPTPETDVKVVGCVGMIAEKFPVWSAVEVTNEKPSRPIEYSVEMSA